MPQQLYGEQISPSLYNPTSVQSNPATYSSNTQNDPAYTNHSLPSVPTPTLPTFLTDMIKELVSKENQKYHQPYVL